MSQARPHSRAGNIRLDWIKQAGILVREIRLSAAGTLL